MTPLGSTYGIGGQPKTTKVSQKALICVLDSLAREGGIALFVNQLTMVLVKRRLVAVFGLVFEFIHGRLPDEDAWAFLQGDTMVRRPSMPYLRFPWVAVPVRFWKFRAEFPQFPPVVQSQSCCAPWPGR